MMAQATNIIEIERIYDLIAEGIDNAGPGNTELFLAKLSLALANLVGDSVQVSAAVTMAGRDL
jgi:hypothetical protein